LEWPGPERRIEGKNIHRTLTSLRVVAGLALLGESRRIKRWQRVITLHTDSRCWQGEPRVFDRRSARADAPSPRSCLFNLVLGLLGDSWPAHQTPRNHVARKPTRSHGQAWLVILRSLRIEPHPEGREHISPGLRVRELSWVQNVKRKSNPEKVEERPRRCRGCNPFRVEEISGRVTQGRLADSPTLGFVTESRWDSGAIIAFLLVTAGGRGGRGPARGGI
jgi:hypothetical protein